MNIVLIGMRGVGKTNIARRLCMPTKRPVMSTDVLVQYDTGLTIPELVARDGWSAFREAEYQVIRKVTHLDGLIIDAGGGVVVDLDEQGREIYSDRKVTLLRNSGQIVFLEGDIDRLADKVANDPSRPALDHRTSATELMRTRLDFYRRAADWTIDVEGRDRQDIAQEILDRYAANA